jgi:hypothetical protein
MCTLMSCLVMVGYVHADVCCVVMVGYVHINTFCDGGWIIAYQSVGGEVCEQYLLLCDDAKVSAH